MSEENQTSTVEAPTSEAEQTPQQKAAAILAARKAKGAGKAESTEVDGEPKAKKERAPKEPKVIGRTGIKFLRDIDHTIDKLNNQQKMIIDAALKLVKEDGEDKGIVYRDELLAELGEVLPGSRQPTVRVLAFYMNTWKKDVEATEKKAAVPALFKLVSVKTVPATAAA